MRVLLIEDDVAAARSIELILSAGGFSTEVTGLGEEGLDIARRYDFDIIVLDLDLPDLSGQRVIKMLRAADVKTPVLVLSGNALVETRVNILGLGADDYMTKPFHKEELIARLHAVVRRSMSHAHSSIATGKILLDLDTKTASAAGVPLGLTSKEYQMLEILSLRKGFTLTKGMLLTHLYGGMDEPEMKIIDVFICKLRKKVAAVVGAEPYIRTIRGRGYQLEDPTSINRAA